MGAPNDEQSEPTILNFSFPYYYLLGDMQEKKEVSQKTAVFLGNDFKNMAHTINRNAYIEQTNLCLDYMRKQCRGVRLVYKPHPNETDEYTYFNMDSFEVVRKEDNEVAEVYFWRNLNEIKYVFSIASGALWSAYILGLNSYTFIKPVEKVLGKDIGSALDYFNKLPAAFFLDDFNQGLRENSKTLIPDPILENQLKKDFDGNGDVWILTGDPGLTALYVSFSNLIKKVFPNKKIHLIMPLHERWSKVKEAHYRGYFDRIITFPRSIYSLRPRKLFKIIKTIVSIKRFSLPKEDILLLFANTNLVENCFLSYFKNKKIAIQSKDYFEINYGIRKSGVLEGEKLCARTTTIFFNIIIEPILGLYRSIYLEYGDGRVLNISRFLKQPTRIYDKIYTLSE